MADVVAVASIRKWESELARRCLQIDYRGAAQHAVYDQVCDLRRMVRTDHHYSVYGALIQTSGLGKTRAVLEMSALGVYLCYCTLPPASSSACPGRTPLLADMLCKEPTEKKMMLYLKAWLMVLDKHLASGVSAEEWMRAQRDGTVLVEEVARTWEEQLQDAGQVSGTDSMELERDTANLVMLQKQLDDVGRKLDDQSEPVGSDPEDSMSDNGVIGEVRVIFVFDEAKGLLIEGQVEQEDSAFHHIRRALRVLFHYDKYFALVLDTDAKMSNLLPRKGMDNSSRARPVGISLLPPIYFLPTMNLYATKGSHDLKQHMNPSMWMKIGRPMWGSRMEVDDKNPEVVKCDSVLRFAGEKLVGRIKSDNFQGQQVDVLAGKMTEGQAMALLGAAAGLDICPRSLLTETLVASHMNLVLRVSKDRSRMYVTIPPEPILSEAACGFLSAEAVQLGALKWMRKACIEGYVTPGPRGEFVAKFILVAAVWSLKKKYCLQPIRVEDYLRKLLSNGPHDRATFAKLKEHLPKKGIVFFNSFVISRKPPDVAMLEEFWVKGQGIMYRAENSLPGADMIVPVWTPSGMTAVIVSVKNLQKPGWLEKVSTAKVRCEFTQVQIAVDLKVVTIVMSLREPAVKDPANWLLWEENKDNEFSAAEAAEIRRHTHLTCYGIKDNYSFLSGEVKSALSDLLVTVPDPFADCDARERRWIETMVPQFAR